MTAEIIIYSVPSFFQNLIHMSLYQIDDKPGFSCT